jgi:hypothetical protein
MYKNGLGYILRDFSTNSSGHPVYDGPIISLLGHSMGKLKCFGQYDVKIASCTRAGICSVVEQSLKIFKKA